MDEALAPPERRQQQKFKAWIGAEKKDRLVGKKERAELTLKEEKAPRLRHQLRAPCQGT